MSSVFAEVGASLQQIGGACPPGWVVMHKQRPTHGHVAGPDGVWIIPVPPVPESISMRQARMAMLNAGILDAVERLVAEMPGDAGQAARIDWGYAMVVRRSWPLVNELGTALGMSDKQIDDMFRFAATVPQ